MKRKCSVCRKEKGLELFYKNKRNRLGISYTCIECTKKTTLVWKKTHPEKVKESRERFYEKNKDEVIRNYNRWSKVKDEGLYRKYWSMIRRCKYPSQVGYKWYGGKGICVEWKSYTEFKKDMYKSYLRHKAKYGHRNTTIDRIDSDKNYCKENCRWTDYKGQAESKKRKRTVIPN